MNTQALDTLVRSLQEEFQGEARGPRMADLLGLYARSHVDWREFAFFAVENYTRNQVTREERFELMILCWGRGQESPIHNHEGQDCWMAVLDGEIEEVRYPMPGNGRPGPLVARGSSVFRRGQVGFIRDEMGLHRVRPAKPESTGVTLHLYSGPYDECNCYDPDTGRVVRRKLFYHSVRGRVLTPNTPS